jgi:hypothetical protein
MTYKPNLERAIREALLYMKQYMRRGEMHVGLISTGRVTASVRVSSDTDKIFHQGRA